MTSCSLTIADRLVLRADGGPPDAEYALFDPNEIELQASTPGSHLEAGYRTTAADALDRLITLGIRADVVDEATRAVRSLPVRTYGRGAWGARVLEELGAAELFDGFVFDAKTSAYEGLWLDLAALARDVDILKAATVLQSFALFAFLSEVDPNADVVLDTRSWMREHRPGARSYKRPDLSAAIRVAQAIPTLRAVSSGASPAERSRSLLVESLKQRSVPAERLAQIELALAPPAIPSLELDLATPAEPPRAPQRPAHVPAPESTGQIQMRLDHEWDADDFEPVSVQPIAIVRGSHEPLEMPSLDAPPDASASSLPPALGFERAEPRTPAVARQALSEGPRANSTRTAPPAAQGQAHGTAAEERLPERPVWTKGASQPPFRTEPPPPSTPQRPRTFAARHAPEPVEHLSLPPGLHGETPAFDRLPRTPMEARVFFTHLARELGREYRQHFGVEVWTDLRGLEVVQAGLRERFPLGLVATQEHLLVLRKHGAFMAELLARTLGAEWTDMAPSEMGYWAMTVPPSTRVWPFGRVHRWVVMGHKERDLVSYYLELSARAAP